jgi:hypothetical protein
MPSQNKYLSQPSIELSKTSKIKSNRLYFSVDVKPEQKDIYKSDQYSQNKKTQTNGYVARVQGIKPHQQDKSSVWPKVRVSDVESNCHDQEKSLISETLRVGFSP